MYLSLVGMFLEWWQDLCKKNMVAVSIVVHNAPESQLRSVLKCIFNCRIDRVFVIDNGDVHNLKKNMQ